LRIWYNSEGERYGEAITVMQDFTYRFGDAGVEYTDFNGDDIDDFVRITPTGLEVAAGLAYGRFAPVEWVPLPEGFVLNQVQVEKAALEDVTSSALPDLLIEGAAPGELWYWINLGNYTLDVRRVITGLPRSLGGNTATRWADMNGNGTADYVFADDLANPRMQVVDIGEIIGCVPSPNLLIKIDNGIGSMTTIGYETSVRFQLADMLAGEPWPDPLPSPVDVVTKVTTDDTLGNVYERTVDYHDGSYSYDWLLFIGFGTVEETLLSADPTAPPMVRRLTFDLGRDEFNLRGSLLRESHETLDGDVFWAEETTWELKELYTGINDYVAVFPHMTARTREVLEGGVGTPRRLEWEFEYDEYGNETANRAYGIVEDGDLGAFQDERIETTTYAINEEAWLIRNQLVFEVTDFAGTVQERTARFYDDETFAGDNPGEVTLGNETLTLHWRDTSDDNATIPAKRVQYDAFGNPILMIDPLGVAPGGVLDESAGHYRRIAYDSHFHLHPVEEHIGVGGGTGELSMTAEYDLGHGTVRAVTNFAGATTTYGHDVFSRFVRSVRPGATEDFPSLEYEYRLAMPVAGGGVVNYVETRLLDRTPEPGVGEKADYYAYSRDYVNGAGSKLQQRREAESATPGGPPRVAVFDAVLFNGRGEIATALQPFFTTAGAGTLDTLLAFEDLRAAGWQGQFHVDGVLTALGLDDAPRTQHAYDALARVIETINPDGTMRTMAYEPMIEVESDENDVAGDPRFLDTPVRRWKNGLDRIARVEEVVRTGDDGTPAADLATWTTIYDWAYDGQIARITDSQGNQKSFSYDGLGNRVLLDDMNQGQTFFNFDDAGNLVRTVDAMGRVITYTFDGANRIRTEDYHDEAEGFSANRAYDPALPIGPDNLPDVVYYYDAPAGDLDLGNGETATAENTLSHLAYVVDLAGETHFSYDARGNRAWEAKRIADPFTGTLTAYTAAMTYDPMDRLVNLIYPDADQVSYAYNARNLISSIGGSASILSAAVYNPAGQRTRFRYGNGVEGSYRYDVRGRLAGLRAAGDNGAGAPLIDFGYGYDPASNVSSITDHRPEAVIAAGDPRRNTQQFDYDTAYRLSSVAVGFQVTGAPVDAEVDYRYDRIGNMLAKTSATEQSARGFSLTNLGEMTYGGAAGANDRVGRGAGDPPGPHALTGADDGETARSFTYDARGNMTQMDDLVLTWDYKDRLVAAEDAAMRAEYAYDYTDQRVVKKVFAKDSEGGVPALPTSTVLYISKHFEVRDNDQPTKYVFADDDRIAKVTGTLDDAAERVQRLRVHPGWNLCTVAVDAADTAAQLGIGTEAVLGAFLLDPDTQETTELFGNTPIPAGSLVWLNAAEAAVVSVRGNYTAPVDGGAIAERGLFAYAGLERFNLARALAVGVDKVWGFGGLAQAWQVYLPGDLAFLSDLPDFVGPGAPVYLAIDGQAEVPLPDAAGRIQFYHPDHLGSSSVLTDNAGSVVEETAYWPFGEVRHQWRASSDEPVSPNPYLFSQKERDIETNLHYFEARYLAASLGRFNRVDPAVENVPDSAIENPQFLHAYAFAGNNPVKLADPDGRFVINPAGKVLFRQLEQDKRERKATIFGDLQFKKGQKFPSLGLTLPAPFEREANKLKLEERLKPNELISSVSGVAETLQSKFPKEGKNALNATKFFERLTSSGDTKENPAAFRELFEGAKNRKVFGSAITESGRIANQKVAKEIDVLQNTLKSIDLEAKFKELTDKVNKSGKASFEFDAKKADAFIEKYLPQQKEQQEKKAEERKDDEAKKKDSND
jgi:RHS repeat-associated protein